MHKELFLHVRDERLLFSIIIPTFNRASLISKTLDSVNAQTYRPIEIIIVDDGSVDNTRERVALWKKRLTKDSKVSVRYCWQKNMGPGAARNLGIAESLGRYLMFLDSDDLLYQDCLEKFAAVFHSRHSDMVIAGCDEVQGDRTVCRHYGWPDKDQREIVAKGELVLMTIRISLCRELVAKMGKWNTHMKSGEDREYFQRALFLAEHAVGIREPLSMFTRGRLDHRSCGFDQACRVQCELDLLEQVSRCKGLSLAAINAVISRIARIGCKLNAMGLRKLTNRCVNAVSGCSYQLSFRVRLQILLCRMGKPGAWIYSCLFRLGKKL